MESEISRPRAGKAGVGIGAREDWQRLGGQLRRRRGALGYPGQTRKQFVRDRVPVLSLRTIIEIENAARANPASFQLETLEQIARSYDTTWPSMRAILTGEADELAWASGEPPRLATTGRRAAPQVRAAAEAGAKVAAVRPYVDPIMNRLLELGGGDPPGDVMFPGDPADAETWDRRREEGWTPLQRAWLLAEVRRQADQDDPAAVAG